VTEVLREVRRLRPAWPIAVRTSLPRGFFVHGLGEDVSTAFARLDVGVVQADSLLVDPEASLRAYAEIAVRRDDLVAAEVKASAPFAPDLVLADIPALAFDVACELGVPGIGLTNFSWDWIYDDYATDFPSLSWVVDDLRRSYGKADLLLRLPMHGDLAAFPEIRDIPLVARHATLGPSEVRTRLDLPQRDRLVLLSFGGMGLTLEALPVAPAGVTFVVSENTEGENLSAECHRISNAELAERGVRYEDLIGASACVVSKPGYGTVAECIANRTRLIYTSRGRFVEYPILVAGIEAFLTNAFVSNDDLRAGKWGAVLAEVLSRPPCAAQTRTDGARIAAETLVAMAAQGRV
jgi:L-arabinokinase